MHRTHISIVDENCSGIGGVFTPRSGVISPHPVDAGGVFGDHTVSQQLWGARLGGRKAAHMTMHIGIVGVSPEGAALCYQQLFRHAAVMLEPHLHPTVSVYNIPLALYIDAVRRDDWVQVGSLLCESANRLASVGAEFCFTPDNAVQHAIQLAKVKSQIPWLKMTDAVAHRIIEDQRKTVGVIGTRYVTTGSAYQTGLGMKGIKLVRPNDDDTELLDNIIFNELVYGIIEEESRQAILGVMRRLCDRGCEGVILGSSEAPLLINPEVCDIPLYNASDIMAEHALRYAVQAQSNAS
ncbi:MAG: aspartate racemase [Phycisphaerae bacterium]|nr:aspartate racemase [Phycisphaerae bacterium]